MQTVCHACPLVRLHPLSHAGTSMAAVKGHVAYTSRYLFGQVSSENGSRIDEML